ncbi:MAG: transcription termination/antitermination protein NusG [Lentisphaeria bacterium]|jgi:transcriptional antiterminator NusG
MSDNDQGQWFVIQTLSGQECKVCESILKRRKQEAVEDVVFDARVPMEKVSEVRRGKKTTVNRKFFPGYILVRAQLFGTDGRLEPRAWYYIRDTQGVIGFIGGAPDRPVAISDQEVEAILVQAQPGEEAPKPKIDFTLGETVTIKDGAFENFEGTVESVDPLRGKLKLSVSIFGRSTPVEVEYWQVERA